MLSEAVEAARRFRIQGEITDCRPMGHGHINKTYLLSTTEKKYTVQRINGAVFSDVNAMMENIVRVTCHISAKRPTIVPVSALDGGVCSEFGGASYRVMTFLDGDVCERAENEDDMFLAGDGFGQFQTDLSDFEGDLYETIPDFHNTPVRYGAFSAAMKNAPSERAAAAAALADKYAARKGLCGKLVGPLTAGKIPSRVTHNDTKINNLILDRKNRRAVCVIDLDTVMRGTLLYDFGDAVRSGCVTAPEDEPDLSEVRFRPEFYRAFLEGFGGKLKGVLTDGERMLFAGSALVMTYECGLRFLTDYLCGDVYFGIKHPEHNLRRAAAQMALLEDMEKNYRSTEEVTDAFLKG